MGTSILSQVAEPLVKATQNSGINVINCTKGGDFLVNFKKMDIPKSNNENDTMILHFLGNNIFNKKKFNFLNDSFHLESPSYLNDQNLDSLISSTLDIISKIKVHFKGKIKLIAAFPRHLTTCCSIPSHSLKPSLLFPSPMHYILYVDQFLSFHPRLRVEKVEYISFTSILGPIFPNSLIIDQVHLSPAAVNKYTHFLSQIQGRKTVIKPELATGTSFLSWVDRKGLPDGVPLLLRKPATPSQRVAPIRRVDPTTQADPATQAVQAEHELNPMVVDEHLLDVEDTDSDGFVYNMEEAMAQLDVLSEDEEEL